MLGYFVGMKKWDGKASLLRLSLALTVLNLQPVIAVIILYLAFDRAYVACLHASFAMLFRVC
jgi:hypothetical protein